MTILNSNSKSLNNKKKINKEVIGKMKDFLKKIDFRHLYGQKILLCKCPVTSFR